MSITDAVPADSFSEYQSLCTAVVKLGTISIKCYLVRPNGQCTTVLSLPKERWIGHRRESSCCPAIWLEPELEAEVHQLLLAEFNRKRGAG